MNKVSGKMLIQQDLQELVKRLNNRMEEALRIFAQKRSRDHFKQIFFNRYKEFPVSVLEDLDSEAYPIVVSIYEEIDEFYWYLMSTEDMPSLVKAKMDSYLKEMNRSFSIIIDYLISEDESFAHGSEVLNENFDYTNDDFEVVSDSTSPLNIETNLDDNFFENTTSETPPPFFENESDEK